MPTPRRASVRRSGSTRTSRTPTSASASCWRSSGSLPTLRRALSLSRPDLHAPPLGHLVPPRDSRRRGRPTSRCASATPQGRHPGGSPTARRWPSSTRRRRNARPSGGGGGQGAAEAEEAHAASKPEEVARGRGAGRRDARDVGRRRGAARREAEQGGRGSRRRTPRVKEWLWCVPAPRGRAPFRGPPFSEQRARATSNCAAVSLSLSERGTESRVRAGTLRTRRQAPTRRRSSSGRAAAEAAPPSSTSRTPR